MSIKPIFVLESEDGDWFLGLNSVYGVEESVILVDDAIQFVRKIDAENFLKFYNEVSIKLNACDTDWKVIEYPR